MSNLFIFTGAGISAESGVSTFRGTSGLWEGHNVDKVCNYLTWQDNYQEVHEFYNARRTMLSRVEPNHAHHMVKNWQDRYPGAVIITQNIDDLFERAGCHDVVHVHGFLTSMRCIVCGHEWDIGYTEWNHEGDICPSPKCTNRDIVKPNVVFFNEVAPLYYRLNKHLNNLTENDVAVVIGTSSNVINIASELEARPCFSILNNLEPSESVIIRQSEMAAFDVALFEPATTAADKIDEILRERLG